MGEKGKIPCHLGGIATEALWDTGSQVSLVTCQWIKTHLPSEHQNVYPMSALLQNDDLVLSMANNTELQYDGYIELNFQLPNLSILVPMLVTRENISRPIMGYNVRGELLQGKSPVNKNPYFKESYPIC